MFKRVLLVVGLSLGSMLGFVEVGRSEARWLSSQSGKIESSDLPQALPQVELGSRPTSEYCQLFSKMWPSRISEDEILRLVKSIQQPISSQSQCPSMQELAYAGQPAVKHLLSLISQNSSEKIRKKALTVLAAITRGVKVYEKPILAVLIPLLSDSDPTIRNLSAETIAGLGLSAKTAVPAIIPLLQDEMTITSATTALIEMGEAAKEAIPFLLPLAKNSNIFAATTLRSIGKPAIPTFIQLLKEPKAELQMFAIAALGDHSEAVKDVIPLLVPFLDHPNEFIRYQTITTLGKAGKPSISLLMPLLSHRDINMGIYALEAIGEMGSTAETTVLSLILHLKSGNQALRSSFIWTLGKIGPPAKVAIPNIIPFLQDPDRDVQRQAENTLEKLGYKP
jgi:HEAT repeat protein